MEVFLSFSIRQSFKDKINTRKNENSTTIANKKSDVYNTVLLL